MGNAYNYEVNYVSENTSKESMLSHARTLEYSILVYILSPTHKPISPSILLSF